MSEISDRYKKSYGPSYRPAQPDYERCCEDVHDQGRWPSFHQCTRKRGFGPDQAYCKQHDPEVAAARRKAADAKASQKWNARRYEWHGRKFFDALEKIADGHNDARGLAQEVIKNFKDGEHT